DKAEVRFRRVGTTPWTVVTCTGPGSSCTFNADATCELRTPYSPCDQFRFQWQARMSRCGPLSGWSALKTFTSLCLPPPMTPDADPVQLAGVHVSPVARGPVVFQIDSPTPDQLGIDIYDVAGRFVTRLEGPVEAGSRSWTWAPSAADGAARRGMYF